ncbi:MAG TPA: hypothetical protein VIH59_07630 [Candidatus Tectomicrobia bacterium]
MAQRRQHAKPSGLIKDQTGLAQCGGSSPTMHGQHSSEIVARQAIQQQSKR